MKGIFDTRPDTGYDDQLESKYHFPDRYLERCGERSEIGSCTGATRRGGSRPGYFSAAQVAAVELDPVLARHSYARIQNYLEFDELVPLLRGTGGFYERELNSTSFRWSKVARKLGEDDLGTRICRHRPRRPERDVVCEELHQAGIGRPSCRSGDAGIAGSPARGSGKTGRSDTAEQKNTRRQFQVARLRVPRYVCGHSAPHGQRRRQAGGTGGTYLAGSPRAVPTSCRTALRSRARSTGCSTVISYR